MNKNLLKEELFRISQLMNLNESHSRINILLNEGDAEDLGFNDCDEVKNQPIYPYLVEYWKRNQEESQTSIDYWKGTLEVKFKTEHKDFIDAFTELLKLIPSTYDDYEEITKNIKLNIDFLNEYYTNNVFIKDWNNFFEYGKPSQIKTYFKNGKLAEKVKNGLLDDVINKFLSHDQENIDNFKAKVKEDIEGEEGSEEGGDGQTTLVTSTSTSGLDCKTKTDLLVKLYQQVKESKVKGDLEKIRKARYITLSPITSKGGSEFDYQEVAAEEQTIEPVVQTIMYPADDLTQEDRTTITLAMMKDDKYELTDFAKTELLQLLQMGIKEIEDMGAVIKSFVHGAKASTSTVNTSFTGKKDKSGQDIPGEFNKDNNVPLVNARITSINNYLKSIINSSIPNLVQENKTIEVLAGENVVTPNVGPEWTSYKPNGYAYGPLYDAARAANKSLTPQQFYAPARREANAEIKNEYNAVFGPFRFNGGYIKIIGETVPVAPGEPDDIISGVGKWELYIQFSKTKKSRNRKSKYKKPKKRLFKLRWGAKVIDFSKIDTLACPFQ